VNVLIIAAHPDDEILGMGGTISRFVNDAYEVHVVIVTKGTEDLFLKSLIETGRNEAKKANEFLGTKSLHFLDGLPAAKLDTIPSYQLNKKLFDIIQEIKPEILFIPHREDIHEDHQLIHKSVLVAVRPNSSIYQPIKIMAYETLSETEWGFNSFSPNVYIDISKHIEAKINAMRCYKSQLKQIPHSRSIDSIRSLARFRGGTINVKYAEAFMLIRHVIF
jgi:LmbE family N-acetylglucosaminyl deacetylase